MDWSLGEEDELLRDTVRGFCDSRIRANARSWDAERALPDALWDELGGMGLLAMELGEEQGGAGLSTVAAATLLAELAAADGSLAAVVAAHNGGLSTLRRAGFHEAAIELSLLAEGQHRLAVAAYERGARTSSLRVGTRARPTDGGYVVRGTKHDVVGAVGAGRLLVVATTAADGIEVSEPDQIVLVLVDADADGVEIGPRLRTLGMRAAGTAHVTLHDVVVPAARVRQGDMATVVAAAQARAAIDTAAIACGILRGALAVSRTYAMEREQFGRPIGKFQAIGWKLADMDTTQDAAWLLTMRAAWQCDQGQGKGQQFAEAAYRARLRATTAATVGCSDALQIHGGYGYTEEFVVERALRDARVCALGPDGQEQSRERISTAIAERAGSGR